jgi:hypothetical protein
MKKKDKLKNIEEANKRLLGEDFEWTGDVPSDEKYKMKSSSKYDLSEKENLDEFMNQLITLWNQYTGHKPNNAAIANDNRAILFNLLTSGELAKQINQRIPPSSLHMGSHGREYWSNNPEQMTKFLNNIGITDFQLKPLG